MERTQLPMLVRPVVGDSSHDTWICLQIVRFLRWLEVRSRLARWLHRFANILTEFNREWFRSSVYAIRRHFDGWIEPCENNTQLKEGIVDKGLQDDRIAKTDLVETSAHQAF